MMKRLGVALCLAAALLMAGGCAGWFGKKPEKTASQLAEEGDAYFQDENYEKAITVYKKLRDWYPYSKYAKTAELRVADANFELEEYEEALFAYEQYERLHPSDAKIPYVIFRIGMCHYERLESIDRTQVPARNALAAFRRLQSRFPQSEYAEKAEPMIRQCLENMAGHEFYVGRFYFKAGHYKAALERFQGVVDDYPDAGAYAEKAADYIERTKQELRNQTGDAAEEETPIAPVLQPEPDWDQQSPTMPRE